MGSFVISDRLYGKTSGDSFLRRLTKCPGILRLREIRMANINFLHYPGFSEVSRYEHSLGVAHLADVAARRLGLNERDRCHLVAAAMYHDAATPPFGHAMDEVLLEYNGIDHEERLYRLLTADFSQSIAGPYKQIFLGRGIHLREICKSADFVHLELDVFQIADLARGRGELGRLLKGPMDLDNIDNVYRAAVNMGLTNRVDIPEKLANSFLFQNGQLKLQADSEPLVRDWAKTRNELYREILGDIDDFRLQAMLKHAIQLALMDTDDHKPIITEEDWCLTDQELLHKLLEHPPCNEVIRRMRLVDLYQDIGVYWVRDATMLGEALNKELRRQICDQLSAEMGCETCLNHYEDKRYRDMDISLTFLGADRYIQVLKQSQGMLLGAFTPSRTNITKELKNKGLRIVRDILDTDISFFTEKCLDEYEQKYTQLQLIGNQIR